MGLLYFTYLLAKEGSRQGAALGTAERKVTVCGVEERISESELNFKLR